MSVKLWRRSMKLAENPYRAPASPATGSMPRRNPIGILSLGLSILGMVSVALGTFAPFLHPASWGSLLCPLGVLAGCLGVIGSPRKASVWAIMLGAVGSMYIPTLWLHWFARS